MEMALNYLILFLWKKYKYQLTVLLPKFLIRQFKYAVFCTKAVTFLDADISKNGPLSSGLPTIGGLSVWKWSSYVCFVPVAYERRSSLFDWIEAVEISMGKKKN